MIYTHRRAARHSAPFSLILSESSHPFACQIPFFSQVWKKACLEMQRTGKDRKNRFITT